MAVSVSNNSGVEGNGRERKDGRGCGERERNGAGIPQRGVGGEASLSSAGQHGPCCSSLNRSGLNRSECHGKLCVCAFIAGVFRPLVTGLLLFVFVCKYSCYRQKITKTRKHTTEAKSGWNLYEKQDKIL